MERLFHEERTFSFAIYLDIILHKYYTKGIILMEGTIWIKPL